MTTRRMLKLSVGWLVLVPAALAQDASPDIVKDSFNILKKYCYQCHGEDFNGNAQFNVVDRESLIAGEYVVPGTPDSSLMLTRIKDGEMPPDGPTPSDSEIATLTKWIESGAEFPVRKERSFKSETEIVGDILAFVRATSESDRPYLRFFTLAHLYNNAKVTDLDMRLYRAALSKAANSLSWEAEIVRPRAVDAAETVYAIDLRDFGWDEGDLWQSILRKYPYALKQNNSDDRQLREMFRELVDISDTDLAYIRADWFVAKATRPPLYHTLLQIPETDVELEKQLRVNVESDFRRNRLVRAGFAQSGISGQNRLVDRHASSTGYYWKSYDFIKDTGKGNLFRFPLGPEFESNPFQRHAFEQDGGEQIFSLPNGLQGYMLIDGVGKRIDEGPIQVVQDSLKTSGTSIIVNGLSCIACHKHGMIEFEDSVRAGNGLAGEAKRKCEELFPEQKKMKEILAKDRKRFLAALETATSEFLQVEEDSSKDILQFAEPVGAVARLYDKDLELADAALEIGIEDPATLKVSIAANPQLRRMGLLALANGKTIKRSVWESTGALNSPAQQTARILGRGTPLVFLGE